MSDKRSPLERAIDAAMVCLKCGAKMGGCDCWTPCPCGWSYEKGGKCRNPVHRPAPGSPLAGILRTPARRRTP